MNEKNLWSKVGLIALLVGLCAWQVWPPQDRLKLGIDLGGGYSVLLEIDDTDDRRADLAERVMTVLRNRVDPHGTMNLVWRPIGRNRLEIQMPSAQRGAEHRDTYNRLRRVMAQTRVSEGQIRAALAGPAEQREQAFDALSRYDLPPVEPEGQAERHVLEHRLELLTRLGEVDEAYARLAATATQPATGEEAREMDRLILERGQLIDDILATNIDEHVFTDVLEMGRQHERREQELQRFREVEPGLAPLIDRVVEAYDRYAAQKGALDDPEDLIRLIRGAGILEFRILAERDGDMIVATPPESVDRYVEQLQRRGPRPSPDDAFRWFRIAERDEREWDARTLIVEEYMGARYVLAHDTPDRALVHESPPTWSLTRASPGQDRQGRLSINFTLDGRGGILFGRLTSNNIGRQLCIFLDDQAISSATIRSEIRTRGEITGSFTDDYVRYLVHTLEAGSLPARVKEPPLHQRNIGPSLGETNRERGTRAVLLAFIATIIFMMIYYMYNGLIADIALLMNLVITLGVMSFIHATFTLPGIAGLVLTLGMAVDANVLIFERIREELSRGVSVKMAIKLGYEKAFSAIFDSNVTTIITAVILASLGSEEIKGFGLTLGIGLCTSMFTALFVTRMFFIVMVPSRVDPLETRRAWLGAAGMALAGGLIFGAGYLMYQDPEARDGSNVVGLGEFLLVIGGTALGLLAAMWIFRFMYATMGHQKANRLPMLKLFSQPKIDWMKKHKVFWTISAVVIGLGLIFETMVDKQQYLDIEFLGGTSVEVQLREEARERFAERGDERLLTYVVQGGEGRISAVEWLRQAAEWVREATVAADGANRFFVTAPESLTESQLESLIMPAVQDYIATGGVATAAGGITIQFDPGKMAPRDRDAVEEAEAPAVTEANVRELIDRAAELVTLASQRLGGSRVQSLGLTGPVEDQPPAFEIVSPETNQTLVAEALIAALGDIILVKHPIEATLVTDLDRAPDGFYPIREEDHVLSEVIGGGWSESVAEHKGGVALVFENIDPPQTIAELEARLREMRLQPGFEETSWRNTSVIGLDAVAGEAAEGQARFHRVAVLVSDPAMPYVDGEDNAVWRVELAEKERDLALAAFESSRALQRVTQFMPQIASEARQKAIIAILLSLIAIAAYLWVRFGSVHFGMAAIIALYHDVAITLSAVMACHHLYDTAIGRMLMLQDFRIDLALIAAFLTIVGYSVNDTIVIFDRIRENRGRVATISPQLINLSLNQTLSRTILTSATTMVAVLIMYIAGGDGIHGFAFALIIGMLTGVYSTIAIATPMLNNPRAMWVVSIILAALTAIGLAWMLPWDWMKWSLVVIIVVLAVYGLFRLLVQTAGTTGRQPVPA